MLISPSPAVSFLGGLTLIGHFVRCCLVYHLSSFSECEPCEEGLLRWCQWRRAWQPTAAFLPRESLDRGAWQAYTLWGSKDSDTTEHARMDRACLPCRPCYSQSSALCPSTVGAPQIWSQKGPAPAFLLGPRFSPERRGCCAEGGLTRP